jgi:hypothetical protein
MADVLPFFQGAASDDDATHLMGKPLIARASPFMTTGNPI